MIARDEEKSLPRLLRSVEGVADEIVLVDTGSVDGTKAIARAAGARVLETAFDDDFSAPRNLGLEAATREWILVLDADEWLAQDAGAVLRAAAADARLAGAYLRFENDLGGGRAHVCALMRFFRNDPAVRYECRIHEQVLPSLARHARATGRKLATLGRATVHHDGYLPAVRAAKDKDARNERLFRRQVEEAPEHGYSWYKFGDFLRRFDARAAEARAALERALALLDAMDDREARELSFPAEVHALLALEWAKAGRDAEALALVERGARRFAATPNLLYVLGHLCTKLGRAREAFVAFARLRAQDRVLHAIPPEPGVTGPLAYHGMARALARLHHPKAARRCFEQALRLDPAAWKTRAALAELLLEQHDPKAAAAELERAADGAPQVAALWQRLGLARLAAGVPKAAEEALLRALERGASEDEIVPRIAEARLLRKDLEGAYLALKEAPHSNECRAGAALLEALAAGQSLAGAAAAAPPARRLAAALAAALR